MAGSAAAGGGADLSAVVHPLQWPATTRTTPLNPGIEQFVDQLLAQMSTEEKVGQLVQADIASITPQDLHQYKLGSILAGGNAAPGNDVRSPAARWLDLANAFYRASIADPPSSHQAIPELFGIDAVHGDSRIPGATVFPQNVGLGAAGDPALIEQIGQVTAEEIAATGLDWTFAPTVAVVRDVRWGRSYESYSEDPALVASYARAMVSGLQGELGTEQYLAPRRTLATVKHFLGDGGTINGRDQFDNLSDERTLREVHAAGYPAAIEAGALTVMASYNSWHGVKMHANHALLTDVLKGRWQFPGFVVGDWNAQEELPGCTKFDCPAMLLAGVDMYMAPDSWRQIYTNLLTEVRSGSIPMARLDDAARRVLRVKSMAGLFSKGPPSERPGAGHFDQLGSVAHRAVARQAVRESLVLLKNNGHFLPLDPHTRVLVAGAGADDIGMQCGGWTIDWQGEHNTNADFPGGTSIFAGIRAAVEAAGGSATLSPDGSFQQRPSVAIVVFGETPYAEFEGDRETLEFSPHDRTQLQILQRLNQAHIPIVSVFLSGRPMWVNRELNLSKAFVAAWLPGTEGAGIADLLFRRGDRAAGPDFTGRLSFSWPATAMPVTFSDSGAVSGAQFARGFGLSLSQSTELPRLSEDPRIPPELLVRDTYFHAGHVTAPWSIYLSDSAGGVRLTTASQPSPGDAVSVRLEAPAVRVSWSGHGPGVFSIGGRAVDLRPNARAGAVLTVRYRLESHPRQPVRVGLSCEAPHGATAQIDWSLCGTRSGAALDLTANFNAAPIGAWQTLSIPLQCLQRAGADFSHVASPLLLSTSGAFALSVSEVRLVPGPGKPRCP
ncbi:MAG TPA: exo 1,3/1,4-beta-D-glucan glucohydrolase [Steroidobacteraceae bacterium]